MDKFERDSDIIEDKKENSERWLLTYSDMITLLLALFIILYSSSAIDADKFKELSKNMSAALNNSKSSQSQTSTGTGSGSANTSKTGTGTKDSLQTISSDMKNYVQTYNLGDKLEIVETADYVKIRIKDTALFEADKAILLPSSLPIVDKIASILKSVYTGIDSITISGNTANAGKDTLFSWDLSSNRAIAVLKHLVYGGVTQDKFVIEGNSHFKPVAANDTEANMAKNRRVEITITKTADEKSSNSTMDIGESTQTTVQTQQKTKK